MPVTTPELFTVAFDGLVLLHTPPPVAHDSDSVLPVHNALPPVIAAGTGFIVATAVFVQYAYVYVIVDVPDDTAVIAPDVAFIVATDVLLLVHEPPG